MPRTSKDRGHYHTYERRKLGGGGTAQRGHYEKWFPISDVTVTNDIGVATQGINATNGIAYYSIATAAGTFANIRYTMNIPEYEKEINSLQIDIYIGRHNAQDASFNIREYIGEFEYTTDDTHTGSGWNLIPGNQRPGNQDTGNTADSIFYHRNEFIDVDLVPGSIVYGAIQFNNLATNCLRYYGHRVRQI